MVTIKVLYIKYKELGGVDAGVPSMWHHLAASPRDHFPLDMGPASSVQDGCSYRLPARTGLSSWQCVVELNP